MAIATYVRIADGEMGPDGKDDAATGPHDDRHPGGERPKSASDFPIRVAAGAGSRSPSLTARIVREKGIAYIRKIAMPSE